MQRYGNIVFPGNKQLIDLKKYSVFLDSLNEDWSIFKDSIQSQVDIVYIAGTNDVIVDLNSARNYYGNNSQTTNHDHFGIVKPENPEDTSVEILKKLLQPISVKEPNTQSLSPKYGPNERKKLCLIEKNLEQNFSDINRNIHKSFSEYLLSSTSGFTKFEDITNKSNSGESHQGMTYVMGVAGIGKSHIANKLNTRCVLSRKYSAKAFHELKKVRDTFKLIMYNMLHGEHCTCT